MPTNIILVSGIQSLTGAGLVGWQFAADGKWDIAERFFYTCHSQQLGDTQLRKWLAEQTSDNIAFEALFESTSGELFFFGVRMTHLDLRTKNWVITKLVTQNHRGQSVVNIVQNVRDMLGDQKLTSVSPDYLELGVFDIWNRVKSLVVWRKGEYLGVSSELIRPQEIMMKTQKPDEGFSPLHEPQVKPLMLEAAWKRAPDKGNNFQYWISLPVSKNGTAPDSYVLSEDRYYSVASTLIGYDPS